MKKIYLACPYSHPDPAICEWRTIQADKAAARLMQEGNIVYSPLSGSHRIAHHMDNHLDHDFWLNQCRAFVDWCDELLVLALDGAQYSKGVAVEVEQAIKKGVSVRWIDA